MNDDKSARVDPRFDPAFQRGFDQSIPIEEYVPEPRSPRSTPAPESARPPVVKTPVVTSAAPAPAPQRAATQRAATPVVAAEEIESEPETESEPGSDWNPSRNPFLLFLGIISIALIAAGVWLFVRTGDSFNSKVVRSQGDYMSLAATIQAAPFIALLGAATAIGVLFVFAAHWAKRR